MGLALLDRRGFPFWFQCLCDVRLACSTQIFLQDLVVSSAFPLSASQAALLRWFLSRVLPRLHQLPQASQWIPRHPPPCEWHSQHFSRGFPASRALFFGTCFSVLGNGCFLSLLFLCSLPSFSSPSLEFLLIIGRVLKLLSQMTFSVSLQLGISWLNPGGYRRQTVFPLVYWG